MLFIGLTIVVEAEEMSLVFELAIIVLEIENSS
jgi:hypothetical protein